MAISYDDWKKQYESMTTAQQKNYVNMTKGNATAEAYAKQYMQEKGVGSSTSNTATNTGSTANNNSNSGVNYTQGTNTQTSTNTNQNGNNGNGTNGGNSTNNQGSGNNNDPISYRNGQTYNYDPNETLDRSKFGETNGQISVKEGTAKDTGMPDYQLDTDARMNEIVSNLNAYYQTNPEFFKDRVTYNNMFHYNERDDAQKALLDSYWTKAKNINTASNYTSGSAFTTALNNGQVTEDTFSALKQYNPEVYMQWQQQLKDQMDQAIVNLTKIVESYTSANTEAIQKLVDQLGIQAGEARDIIGGWEEMMTRTGAWESLETAKSNMEKYNTTCDKMTEIMKRYSASGSGASDTLIAARLNKALAPYQQQASNYYSAWQMADTDYKTRLGTANDYANTIVKQAAEDQRIFQNKLSALGFAMQVNSYRTPEQQAALQLQTQQVQNDMELLQQSQLNDLNLYNQYATAKLQNQLNYELTDLTTTDPTQLRANLKNVLDGYYEQYGDIIQRSESQVIEDVIKQAQEEGISVAEALRKNFIEPLQGKTEYKNAIASKYAAPENKYQTKWNATIDGEGNIEYDITGYGDIPQSFANITNRAGVQSSISKLSDAVGNPKDFISMLTELYPEGTYGGQCGEFCNDVLLYGYGDDTHFGSDFWSKKYNHKNKEATEKPKVGDIYLMSNTKNANGHMGVIAGVDSDGSVTIMDSNGVLENGEGTGTIRYKTYTASEWQQLCTQGTGQYKVEGYYESPAIENSNQMTTVFTKAFKNAGSNDAKKSISNAKLIYDTFSSMKENDEMEALITDSFGKDLFSNLVTQKFSDEEGSGNAFYQALSKTLSNEVNNGMINETTKAAVLNVARAVEQKLRKESGAAISASERASNFFNYMPGQGKGVQADIETLQARDRLLESWVGGYMGNNQSYIPLFDRTYIYQVMNGYNGASNFSYDDLPEGASKGYSTADLLFGTWFTNWIKNN